MRRTGFVGIAAAVACAALLTGCSTSTPPVTTTVTAQPTATAATTPVPTSTPAPTTVATASAAPTAAAGTDPNAPAGQCPDSALAVSVQADPTASGAGHAGSFVVFRNTGRTSCTLRGWPGVSLVGDGNGTRIGAAATEQGALQPGVRTVSIRPGAYALAALSYPNIDATGGAYGDGTTDGDPTCKAQHADGYRVYPPHSFRAFFSRANGLYGCSTQQHLVYVSPVTPASDASRFTPKP